MEYDKSEDSIFQNLHKEYNWFIQLKTDAYFGDARATIILAMMKDFD